MTTSGAASGDGVGIRATPGFQWYSDVIGEVAQLISPANLLFVQLFIMALNKTSKPDVNGACINTALWRRPSLLTNGSAAFKWKLRSHMLNSLRQRHVALVNTNICGLFKEVNPRLAKRPLRTNGRSANRRLISLVKEATGRLWGESPGMDNPNWEPLMCKKLTQFLRQCFGAENGPDW